MRGAIGLELRRTRVRLGLARRALLARERVDDPVFVVSAGRTGSQLLADYLNCLPGVTVLDEVLNAEKVVGLPARLVTQRGVERHLRHSIEILPGPVRGAKLLLSQMEQRRLGPERLRELFPGVRFVVLYRRLLAEQYISLQMANATGRYAARSPDGPSAQRVHVDPDDLRRYYDRVKARYRAVLAQPWVRERSVVVSYEDLTTDPQGVIDERVCPLLGVPSTVVTTTLFKQNRRSLADTVANFEEVRELLTGEAARHDYA